MIRFKCLATNSKKVLDYLHLKKLHYLIETIYLGVLALTKKEWDVDTEIRGQGSIARVKDQRLGDQK